MSATATATKPARRTKTSQPIDRDTLLERALWAAGEATDDRPMGTEEADRLRGAITDEQLKQIAKTKAEPGTLKRVPNAPLREAFERRRHEAATRARRATRLKQVYECSTPGCEHTPDENTRFGLFCTGCSDRLARWAAEAKIEPEPRSAPVFQEAETCEGLARRVGVSSGTTVARDLGLRVTSEGSMKDSLRVPKAIAYCLALDLDPHEIGA